MRARVAALLVALTLLLASVPAVLAPPSAEAHSPSCHTGTRYPYMYWYRVYYGRVTLNGAGPYDYYKYWYINVSSGSTHSDSCFFYVGLV